jgi:hypothetical protein
VTVDECVDKALGKIIEPQWIALLYRFETQTAFTGSNPEIRA